MGAKLVPQLALLGRHAPLLRGLEVGSFFLKPHKVFLHQLPLVCAALVLALVSTPLGLTFRLHPSLTEGATGQGLGAQMVFNIGQKLPRFAFLGGCSAGREDAGVTPPEGVTPPSEPGFTVVLSCWQQNG